MTRLSFIIPGEPRGKDRPRAVASIVYRDGEPEAVVRLVTPSATREAERRVLQAFRLAHPRHAPFTGPVLIRFVAVFGVPSSWPNRLKEAAARGTLYCVKKPDKDNIEKLVVDALKGFAWVDDQQVMGGGIKRYGSPARIEVTIESLVAADVPATPGQQRLEARVAAGEDVTATRPKRRAQTKSSLRNLPAPLRARVEAAPAKEGSRGR